MDGGEHRGRGAPAGVLLDQGVRPALQREVPRRQVLPVARGHPQRGVPAGDGRPRREEARRALLRPLLPRLGDPRDRRPAAAGVPDAVVQQRRLQAVRADRPALPARLHRQVLGALRRPGHAPRSTATIVDDFCDFMAGQTTAFVKRVEKEMYAASAAQDYERAARLRDDIGALNRAMEKQQVVLGDGTDADVVALSEDPLEVAVQIFYVRGGRIRGQRGWVADKVDDADTAGLVERFLLQLYDGELGDSIPREVLVPALPEDTPALEQWLSDLRGGRVSIKVPQRGDKKALQETVGRNALQALGLHKTKRASDLTTRNRALGGDPGRARSADRAAACRVLRHLEPPGHRGGRLDGGLRGRPGPQERVPPLRHQGRRGPERRRLDARGDHPAVPAAARRARGDRRVRRRPGRPAGADADRPGHRPAQEVRLRPRARGRRRRSAPGGGRRSGRSTSSASTTCRWCGLAKRLEEVLAAQPGGPGDPAAHQRGALPPPADPRRGAPLRDHPPPVPAVQEHGRERARRRRRAWERCAARACSGGSAR